jgi:hypothetical protein
MISKGRAAILDYPIKLGVTEVKKCYFINESVNAI